MEPNRAIVLQLGIRFFAFYKKGRVTTAWSLAGAKLFGEWDIKEIERIEAILTSKRYRHVRKMVLISDLPQKPSENEL